MQKNKNYSNKHTNKSKVQENVKPSALLAKMIEATKEDQPTTPVVYMVDRSPDGTWVTTARAVSDLPPRVQALLARSSGKASTSFYAGLKEVIANIEDEE